jgi:hypothetical protein
MACKFSRAVEIVLEVFSYRLCCFELLTYFSVALFGLLAVVLVSKDYKIYFDHEQPGIPLLFLNTLSIISK